MQYKAGQIITSTREVELETALSGKKVKVPTGNKVIIGADKLAHHIYNGMIQPIQRKLKSKDTTLTGSQNTWHSI